MRFDDWSNVSVRRSVTYTSRGKAARPRAADISANEDATIADVGGKL